jgi:very-short-patch-repair endonuclease
MTTELFATAARQRGLVRRDDARRLGFTAKRQRGWIRRGEWEAVGTRLLFRAGAPVDKGTPLMQAVLDAGTGGVVAEATGAAWWGLPGYDLLNPHINRPRCITGMAPSVAMRLHEVSDMSTNQVTVLDGIPVVRPERLAFELFATSHPARAARAVETAWSKGLLSGASLRATFDELAERGRTGTVAMRQFLETHPEDWVPPASNLEARFMSIAAEARLGTWNRQVDVGATTWVGRVDFLHERLPVIVEVQSERYQTALLDAAADAVRKAALESAGFVVVEVWDTWVWHDKRRAIEAVRAALRLAGSRRAA